jgi:hypothetical protein
MTEAQGMHTTLTAKVQAFINTLAPEDATQLLRMAQETLGQDQLPDHTRGAAPAASGRALPATLVDKLREFAGSLSPDERSAFQSAAQGSKGEVQGYLGTIIPSQANKLTYKEAVGLVNLAAQTGVWVGPKPK